MNSANPKASGFTSGAASKRRAGRNWDTASQRRSLSGTRRDFGDDARSRQRALSTKNKIERRCFCVVRVRIRLHGGVQGWWRPTPSARLNPRVSNVWREANLGAEWDRGRPAGIELPTAVRIPPNLDSLLRKIGGPKPRRVTEPYPTDRCGQTLR